jgi:hypothetical protein
MWPEKQKSIFFRDLAKLPGKKKGEYCDAIFSIYYNFPQFGKILEPKIKTLELWIVVAN